MSYLDLPRFHLAGRFFAYPSTVNNDPAHYDPNCVNPSPWQTPNGTHDFKFEACRVVQIFDETGSAVSNDPLLGAAMASCDAPVPAKIVDLDVYQQGVSTIFGLSIQISLADAVEGEPPLTGAVAPPVLNGIWFTAVIPTRSWTPSEYEMGSYGGDGNAAGCFQTFVAVPLASLQSSPSPVLNRLGQVAVVENGAALLSFKFNLDGYINVPNKPGQKPDASNPEDPYCRGRFVGTIGPVLPNEPRQTPGRRWLKACAPNPQSMNPLPAWNTPGFYDAPFTVDQKRKRLVIDWANSLCRKTPGGDPAELGMLRAVIFDLKKRSRVPLGPVDNSGAAYNNQAGIVELSLTDEQLALIESNPLLLSCDSTDFSFPAPPPGSIRQAMDLFAEDESGLHFAFEERSFRLVCERDVLFNPNQFANTVVAQVYATRWGEPLQGLKLNVAAQPVLGTTPGATVPPTNPGDSLSAEGALQATISATDEHGFAQVSISVVKDPSSRTDFLDGQLYFINVWQGVRPPPAFPQEQQASCLVWSHYPVNSNPDWKEIQSLMLPYARLYPAMKERIDLSDESTFSVFAKNINWHAFSPNPPVLPPPFAALQSGAIPFYLTRALNDPTLMPISRDLSPNRIATVLYYCARLQGMVVDANGNVVPPPPPS